MAERHLAVDDIDNSRALRTALAHVATLKVAGEDDVRVGVQHCALVDVPERPIVVSVPGELLERAGRIVVVVGVAAKARVQQADVREPRDRSGVSGGEVFGHRPGREALAVNGHSEVVEHDAFGPVVTQDVDARQLQVARDHAGGVVVAADHHNLDALLSQTRELRAQVQAGAEVLPVAVVHVAGEEQEIGVLRDAQLDQRLEGVARSAAHGLDRRAGVGGQPLHGAVDVRVGRVNELHHATRDRAGRTDLDA